MPKLKNSLPLAIEQFDRLPDDGLIRVKTVAPLLGVSVATIWRWLAGGKFPRAVKVGTGTTAWRVGDIRRFIRERQGEPLAA